ncbi:MAG: alpha/beta hydrolase family protein, partial [Anaerolineae bacterium]|nr:alpha/beta hydrolase family protein [Anaerolineae bacterium]
PEQVPLEARQIDESDQGGHLRQKWVMQTEADFWQPFYLLLPKNITSPRPAVLSIHGHGPGKSRNVGMADSDDERAAIARDHEDFGLQAVRQGYIAFCPDVRAFGECTDEDHQDIGYNISCRSSAGRSIMLGRTLVGERVWDVMRGIDFLYTRPDVNTQSIACVGHSGGGTVTLFAAAVEPRITAAVVNAYLCAWGHSIYGTGHCPCNYIPHMARYADCGDVGALIAPRPLLINTGEIDPIFPVDGVYQAYMTVGGAYGEQGAASACELYVGEEGHRFYPERTWSFLAQWL